MIRPLSRAAALALLLVLAACESAVPPAPVTAVAAAAARCEIPTGLTPAPAYDPPAGEIVRDVDTAYYLLALSWSPQACRSGKDYPDPELQCRDNRFGLTLHGLWPNGPADRHPRYCGPAPALQPATVRANFCMTPSPTLQQHEWAAHGTCGWASPEAYFARAGQLWDDLVMPDLEAIPADRLTAGAIRNAFVAANPDLPRTAIAVVLADDVWLREVRLCYAADFARIACPRGTGAPDRQRLRLSPRGTATTR
jgi:ribonuclease T2